jgi:hypothetical protein
MDDRSDRVARAHNPKVAGSNPAPATRKQEQYAESPRCRGLSCCSGGISTGYPQVYRVDLSGDIKICVRRVCRVARRHPPSRWTFRRTVPGDVPVSLVALRDVHAGLDATKSEGIVGLCLIPSRSLQDLRHRSSSFHGTKGAAQSIERVYIVASGASNVDARPHIRVMYVRPYVTVMHVRTYCFPMDVHTQR